MLDFFFSLSENHLPAGLGALQYEQWIYFINKNERKKLVFKLENQKNEVILKNINVLAIKVVFLPPVNPEICLSI